MVQTEPKKHNFLSVTLDTVIVSGLGLLLQLSLWTLAKTVKKSKISVSLFLAKLLVKNTADSKSMLLLVSINCRVSSEFSTVKDI